MQRTSHRRNINMSTSRAEEIYKKFEKTRGKPPANASQLVGFAKKLGGSLKCVDARKYIENLPKKAPSKPKKSTISKAEKDETTKAPLPKRARYSKLSREELEREMDKLENEIGFLKKVTTF